MIITEVYLENFRNYNRQKIDLNKNFRFYKT